MADNNNPNQVIIEIVLDDGSVQKGFAKFKSSAEDTSKKVEKSFDGSLESFKDSILGIPKQFLAIGAAATSVGVILKKAFDLTIEGEKISAINKQFDILSNQAVGAGNNLKSALDKASGGFVDTEDLLKSTNKVLIDFKGNSADLPAILELSRKAAKVTGNDILQTYEEINKAIASQNTRALKNSGIFIDATKVQQEYAKSIGKTSEQLTDQEKRQAITNAALSVSNKQLKDISLEATTATAAYKQFNVQLNDVSDSFSIIASKAFGGLFKNVFSGLSSALESFNTGVVAASGSGMEKLAAQIKLADAELKRLKETSDKGFFLPPEQIAQRAAAIENLTSKLANLTAIQRAAEDDAKRASQNNGSGIPANVQAAIDSADTAAKARVMAEQKANAEILQGQIAADQALLNARIAGAQAEVGFDQNFELQRIAQDAFNKEQERINEETHQAELIAVKQKYADLGLAGSAQAAAAIENVNKMAMAREVSTFAQASAAKQAIEKKERDARFQQANSFFGNLSSLTSSSSKELFEIGKAASIANATLSGYQAVQNALAVQPFPLGLALAASAAVSAAQNIAGIASTSFGGGGASPSVPGGGASPSPFNPTDLTPVEDRERSPQQGLVVNVNGDILGDEASGKRLVDLMNSAFDASGVSLRQGLV